MIAWRKFGFEVELKYSTYRYIFYHSFPLACVQTDHLLSVVGPFDIDEIHTHVRVPVSSPCCSM